MPNRGSCQYSIQCRHGLSPFHLVVRRALVPNYCCAMISPKASLWITPTEKKGRAHPQHRIESGLEMGCEKPEVFVEFTSDAGKEVSGDLVVQVLTGVDGFTKGIRVMRDIVNEPLQLRRAIGGRKIGFFQSAVGCDFARGSVGYASKSHDALANCVGLFLDVRGDRIK